MKLSHPRPTLGRGPLVLTCLACLACCAQAEPTVEDDLGAVPRCQEAATTTERSSALELALLEEINRRRARGGQCGELSVQPSPALTLDPALRCASRLHARDQAALIEIGPQGTDGSGPLERIAQAGYSGRARGELLASHEDQVTRIVDAWMDSSEHCTHLLDRGVVDAGPGHHALEGDSAWVLTTGEAFTD